MNWAALHTDHLVRLERDGGLRPRHLCPLPVIYRPKPPEHAAQPYADTTRRRHALQRHSQPTPQKRGEIASHHICQQPIISLPMRMLFLQYRSGGGSAAGRQRGRHTEAEREPHTAAYSGIQREPHGAAYRERESQRKRATHRGTERQSRTHRGIHRESQRHRAGGHRVLFLLPQSVATPWRHSASHTQRSTRTEAYTHREPHTESHTQRDTSTHTEAYTQREAHTQRHTHSESHTQRSTRTERATHRQTDTYT
jgi:hypothetical protein